MESKKEITGNTLRVYLFLVKNGPCELREIQRALNFSTASLASYHLNKLIELGYAERDSYGRYSARMEAASQVIDGFTRLGSFLVPQVLFFSVLFTILIGYLSYRSLYSSFYVPFLIIVSVCCVIVMWYETFRLWKKL